MIRLPDNGQRRLGKYYLHIHRLVEIDDMTGDMTTVKFSSYPAKEDDWMLINLNRAKTGNKVKAKPKKELPVARETVEEVI